MTQATVPSSNVPALPDEAVPGWEGTYDPVHERLVARRLKAQRWRRFGAVAGSVLVAALAAGGFTLANRDLVQSEMAEIFAAAPAATTAPSLASSSSAPVQLSALEPEAPPEKLQERIAVPPSPLFQPAPPDLPSSVAAFASESPAPGAARLPEAGASADPSPAVLPAVAPVIPFAPLPPRRPADAP